MVSNIFDKIKDGWIFFLMYCDSLLFFLSNPLECLHNQRPYVVILALWEYQLTNGHLRLRDGSIPLPMHNRYEFSVGNNENAYILE